MINSFLLSYEIKNAYRTNGFIYYLKHFPIIKRILPDNLYQYDFIKIIANIFSAVTEFFSIFLGKFIYMFLMIFLASSIYKNPSLAYINIFVFLTIIGGLLNTSMFNTSKDKYYAICLMHFDAKKYVLSNYLYFMIKNLVGLLPFALVFGFLTNTNLLVCMTFSLLVVSLKNIVNAIYLRLYEKRNYIPNEGKFNKYTIIISLLLLILAYGLPYINIGITSIIYIILLLISLPISYLCYEYIMKFNMYSRIYKKLLVRDDIIVENDKAELKMYGNMITNTESGNEELEGFKYFNDLFVKRHKKILTASTKRFSIVSFAIIVIVVILSLIFNSMSKEINDLLKTSLPYFMFIMYFMNRGKDITMCMFMNCDHAMLTYRFYRQPKEILLLFKERLKVLIKLNIIPGIIIATGTVILLCVTGGTSIINYILTFVSIISMSIFFSIHYLVLYYLLQPYNVDLEVKNPLFSTIIGLTYLCCYLCVNLQMPTILFGSLFILFTIIYSIIGLYVAYKYSYKTFRLK